MKKQFQERIDKAETAYSENPTSDTYKELESAYKQYELGYMLFGTTDKW